LLARLESGAAAGASLALCEAIPPDDAASGVPVSLAGYPRLDALDVPEVHVAALVESSIDGAGTSTLDPNDPLASRPLLGLKPAGDLPVAGTAAAVLAALRDAVGAAPSGLPTRPSDLPVVGPTPTPTGLRAAASSG
jgi:CO/xanthine dehydrogenase Mo-binding subunit